MADRLRIVSPQWPRRSVVVLDLSSATIQPVRDSFKVAAAKKNRTSVPQPGRDGGSRIVGERLDNAEITVTLYVQGTTGDNALTIHSALLAALDQVVPGQYVEWRPDGATRSTYYEIRGTADWDPQYKWAAFKGANLLTFGVRFEVAPRGVYDYMDVWDDFAVDSVTAGDWALDTGTAPTVSGGLLAPTNANTFRLRHTATGYTPTDAQTILKLTTGATVSGYGVELFGCASVGGGGFDTYLYASISATTLSIGKRVAGSATSLASTGVVPATATSYWILLRKEGNVVTAMWFASEPTPMGTPAAAIAYTLTVSEAAQFRSGYWGFRSDVADTVERYEDYRLEPFTYGSVTTPQQIVMLGAIPGDAPARADLHITTSGAGAGSGAGTGAGGQQYPVWASAGWLPRAKPHNEVWNGDFEDDADGWTNAAVTGVIAAATSAARDTTAARNKYGAANLSIVCPATTDTGASFAVYQRVKKGRRYLAMFWASSAAGVTAVRAKLGVNGDVAAGTASALTTVPTLRWVVWTPAADRDSFTVAAGINAATGTTWSIDGVIVCETPNTDLSAAIVSTSATTLTVTSIPDGPPSGAPFLCLVDDEILRVTDASTTTWTIERGQEGTTAATHLINSAVYVLPVLRPHLEGKGAQAPFGIIEAESRDGGVASSLAVVTDANYRCGAGVRATAAGSGNGVCEVLLDPHLLLADDFTAQEIDVQVWGRFELASTLVTPVFVGSFLPVGGAFTYTERYAAEYASAGLTGKTLAKPSSGTVFRYAYLGTFTIPVDPANPLRWRFRGYMTWQTGSTGSFGLDYFEFVPRLANMRGAERQALNTTYPSYATSTTEATHIQRADGRGAIAYPPLPPTPYHPLGGKLMRLDPGANDLVVKLSSMVPDDQSASLTDSEYEEHAATIHVAVQPCAQWARSA